MQFKLKHHQLKTYVTTEDYCNIKRESTARRTSVAKVVRDSISEYFQLRQDLANAIEKPGALGDSHSGKIIHSLLARTEERFQLAITDVENKIQLVIEQIKMLTIMIDRLYWDVMYHLPRVPDDIDDTATIKANQRHQQWLEKVARVIPK